MTTVTNQAASGNLTRRHLDNSVSDDRPFKVRQRAYLARILERKWDCEIPGHTVCVSTTDGYHHQLTDQDFETWLDALCLEDATTSKPPKAILNREIDQIDQATSSLKHGSSTFRGTVDVVPYRSQDIKLPAFAASASIYQRIQHVSSSWPSSGVLGTAFYSGRAIKWLGERSLDVADRVILFKRARKYIRWLEQWEKELGQCSLAARFKVGKDKQKVLFKILEEALEMSRPCYSARVNACAAEIGSKLVAWSNWTGASYDTRLTDEMALWFSHIHSCVMPLAIASSYRKDPSAADVVCELLDAITSVPVAHQDPESVSAVVRICARDLAFSPYSSKHRRIGQALARMIQLVVQIRPLRPDELLAIRDIASRRLDANSDGSSGFSRPWEIAIFMFCELQDPWFTQVVRGPHGLPSVLSTLISTLSKPSIARHEEWLHLCDILHIVSAIAPGCAATISFTPGIMEALLCAFRGNMPRRWFIIQDRVVNVIQAIIRYRPALLHDLIRLDGETVLRTFTLSRVSGGATRSRQRIKAIAISKARGLLNDIKAAGSASS